MSPGRNAPEVHHERYLARMQPRVERWERRAELPELPWNRRMYAAARARGIRRPHADRVERCNTRGAVLKCGCRGRRTVRWYGCRQHMVCAACARSRARAQGRRMTDGLAAAAHANPDRMIVLITLTVEHSGDVLRDRKDLADGWRKFYKSLNKRGVSYPYVGVWEVTPGRDGQGHVHAHVAALWPWIDWGELHDLWRAACPRSARISFVARRRDGARTDPRGAAKYLAKYITKGVQDAELTPELRADVLAAFYGARMVFSSVGFFAAFVPCCPDCGLRRIRAIFRWHGVANPGPVVDVDERGAEQLGFDLVGAHQRAGPGCT